MGFFIVLLVCIVERSFSIFGRYSRDNSVINFFSSYLKVRWQPRCWIRIIQKGRFFWVETVRLLVFTWSEFKSARARLVFICLLADDLLVRKDCKSYFQYETLISALKALVICLKIFFRFGNEFFSCWGVYWKL